MRSVIFHSRIWWYKCGCFIPLVIFIVCLLFFYFKKKLDFYVNGFTYFFKIYHNTQSSGSVVSCMACYGSQILVNSLLLFSKQLLPFLGVCFSTPSLKSYDSIKICNFIIFSYSEPLTDLGPTNPCESPLPNSKILDQRVPLFFQINIISAIFKLFEPNPLFWWTCP